MKVSNPIVDFLRALLATGKTTKERICVTADLKYPTFDNTFDRPTVSPLVKKSLLFAGIVPKTVVDRYDLWLQTEYKPKKEKKNAHTKTSSRNKNKSKSEDRGTSEASY